MSWPALQHETLTWRASGYESRSRSLSGPYQAAIAPEIAKLSVTMDSETSTLAHDAALELARFDSGLGGEVASFGPLLLRSEAVASSQIENLTASARQVLTAELGDTSKRNANLIVANTRAMQAAIALSEELTTDSVREMHRVLMESTPRHTPGEYRTEAVWIGTESASPIGAEFVAPHHSRIPAAMEDLMSFARRDDLPFLAQIAIAHAQFETIHPFSDGNGRTGRALMQSMLRAKRVTRMVTVPVSAGLLTDVDAYHRSLTSYRNGDVGPIIRLTAESSLRAIENAGVLVRRLQHVRAEWATRLAGLRRDAAGHRLADLLIRQPVTDAKTASRQLGIEVTNVYRAVAPLERAKIVIGKNEYRIGRVWRADEVLAELDQFAERSGRRSSATVRS